MKKFLYPLALAIAMSTGTVAHAQSSGDGPCYDNCLKNYNDCKGKTPVQKQYLNCYIPYVKCQADCDAQINPGGDVDVISKVIDYEDERPLSN